MKAKSLILVVGVLLLSGFVGSAFAETDPIGDRLVHRFTNYFTN